MSSALVPAATVVPLRDGAAGIEALLVRRSSKLEFAGGMWVFPGGRVDGADQIPGRPDDQVGAARRAAVREAHEEAGLELDDSSLVTFSNWTPPAVSPRRFATWFFLASAPSPDGAITVDGSEIRDHRWIEPADALRRRDAGEIELSPPTWVTLAHLQQYRTVDDALAAAADRQPPFFETHIGRAADGTVVAMYDGDAGYADEDADRPGPRRRLWMGADRWWWDGPGELP